MAALGLAGPFAFAEGLVDPIPGLSQTSLIVRAAAGDRFLVLGGRYVSRAEGPIETGLGLTLNGAPLDGARLRGPAELTTPLFSKGYGSLVSRYNAGARAFAFKRDADEVPNNGPWTPFWNALRYKSNHALPWIQLEAGDLLKEGDNLLVVTNLNGARFLVTELHTAPAYTPRPDPLLPMPNWIVFSQSPGERALYEKALAEGLFHGAEKAELLAALGMSDIIDRRAMKDAAARWAEAFKAAPDFPSRTEVLYRVVAERLESGAWLLPEDAIRAALKAPAAPDGWTGLAQAVLADVDGVATPGSRLAVTPPLAAAPARIDGVLDEDVWREAQACPLQYAMGTNTVRAGWGEVRFAFSPDRLLVGFSGRLPASAAWIAGTNRDASVWQDNAVELLLTSDMQFRTYYELNASAKGVMFDGRHGWFLKVDPGWNGDWLAASKIDGDRFTMEYGIPWKMIGLDGPPAPNRRLVATAIRVLVEKNGKGEPAATFLTVTPHRGFESHRLMDGVLIRAATPPVKENKDP